MTVEVRRREVRRVRVLDERGLLALVGDPGSTTTSVDRAGYASLRGSKPSGRGVRKKRTTCPRPGGPAGMSRPTRDVGHRRAIVVDVGDVGLRRATGHEPRLDHVRQDVRWRSARSTYSASRTAPRPSSWRRDDEGAVVATLVHRSARVHPGIGRCCTCTGSPTTSSRPRARTTGCDRGYDFYALDLRKYGRSLRSTRPRTSSADLSRYYEEIDEAYRPHHRARRPPPRAGLGALDRWARHAAVGPRPAAGGRRRGAQLAVARPAGQPAAAHRRRPRRSTRSARAGPTSRSRATCPASTPAACTATTSGEWDFDLAWKPLQSWPVYAGWLRAVRRGHARAHRGLDVAAPVLVLTSGASGHPKEYDGSARAPTSCSTSS